jgi:hypothetical protein
MRRPLVTSSGSPPSARTRHLQRPQPAQRLPDQEAGASLFKLTEMSRHKSLDTLRGYVRRVDLFKEHAGAAFL